MHGRVWSCIMSGARTWTVGVTGATGYAGGEVCRLLAGHPDLRLAGVHANASAGRRLGELQPHLLPYADLEVRPSDADSLAGYDVVVLALPHGESAAVAAGLPEPDVVVVAASGTSGAGKAAKPHLLGSEVMGSVSAYGVGGVHRHTPEMVQNLTQAAGRDVTVSFTPTLVPMSRGILATCSAPLAAGVDEAAARAAYAKAYADEPFVHLLPEGQWPTTAAVLGANTVALQVAVDPDAARLVVVAAVDNLTKGTGGAAIQCANLALGLPGPPGSPPA